MPIPHDYPERVYAGVLGKIIGVYLGRPFEGWSYDHILRELGEVWYYVHEQRKTPLIVTDDDISGTFTFLRALPDYGNRRDLTPAQIGQTWRNYIIENRTILWWGGMGNSTEHTAFLRLKAGIEAPASGSIATNGKVVAEQIGAQIFIDGWGMVAPGDPEFAADLARRAASVSHDGEAIYGAQVIAAMEAQAFIEADMNRLLDVAVGLIPKDSVIYRLIADLRTWHAHEADWRKTREQLQAHYGYDKFGGGCHMVPNHGVIVHALLHGEGDFQKSLMIANTDGWDTDCNSGNVGCLLGILNGLAGIDNGPDWRGPVADRLFLPTADGGRCITDAVHETMEIVNIGRALAGEEPVVYKNGARFHFELPGSVQGFQSENSPMARDVATVENVEGHSATGKRSLAIRYRKLAPGRAARVATATFIPEEAAKMEGYGLFATPTLNPGQTVHARLKADEANTQAVACRLYLRAYNKEGNLVRHDTKEWVLEPGKNVIINWTVGDLQGQPIAEIGVEVTSEQRADGTVYLDYLTWDGTPRLTLEKPQGEMARRAWVNGVDHFEGWGEPYRLIQDAGTGLLIYGTREWTDYTVSATITPHLTQAAGLAARVQGMTRYYALLLGEGKARLIKALDGEKVLAEQPLDVQFGVPYALSITVQDKRIQGSIDGKALFDVNDENAPLMGGGIALVCTVGRLAADQVLLVPVD